MNTRFCADDLNDRSNLGDLGIGGKVVSEDVLWDINWSHLLLALSGMLHLIVW